jgi:hypothetical protein
MKVWQAAILAVALSSGTACSDLTNAPTSLDTDPPRIEAPTDGPQRSVSSGSQTPPASVPPEYQHYTWIDVDVDAGWVDAHTAYGQTIVRYGGNNATADIDLSVRDGKGALIASNHGSAQASHVFPVERSLYASTNVYVTPTCGLVAQGTGTGSVYDSFLSASQSMLTWGKKIESGTKSVPQPECAPTTCLDASATNYGGPLPCTYPPPPAPPSGGDGAPAPPSFGTPTEPVVYEPGPSTPSGHWECTIWYMGTDYEREYCTWYGDYARIAAGDATRSRSAGELAGARTTLAADLPSVFVIVSDQVPADAMAVIERRRQGPFRNVLLVPSASLRPADFVAALRALADSRAKDGETPVKDLQLTLKGSVLDQQIPRAVREYAAAFTALVARAKRADAGAYGTRQVLEIRLADRR